MSLTIEDKSPVNLLESELTIFNRKFPKDAVAYAVNNTKESTPILLGYIQHALNNVETLDHSYMGHLYALFILSQFREVKTFPFILELCRLSYDQQEMLLGDCLTESLAQFIGSTFDGNLAALKSIIESDATHYYARAQSLHSLFVLLNDDLVDEEVINSYIPLLFDKFMQNSDKDGMTMLVHFCCDYNPKAYLDEMKKAFELNLVDEDFIDLNFVMREVKKNRTPHYKTDKHYQPIQDASEEMSWWDCFKQDKQKTKSFIGETVTNNGIHHHKDGCGCGTSTIKYSSPKLGRNDPCHCGSGKKYKKCCLN